MSGKADPNSQAQATDRGTRICRVLDDYLACRARGESVSSDDVIQMHPDLMPELADEFAKLELIDQAQLGAKGQDSTVRWPGHSAADRDSMVLRCPHCQLRFEVDTETSLADIRCPACGSEDTVIKKTVRPVRHHQCRDCEHRFKSVEEQTN